MTAGRMVRMAIFATTCLWGEFVVGQGIKEETVGKIQLAFEYAISPRLGQIKIGHGLFQPHQLHHRLIAARDDDFLAGFRPLDELGEVGFGSMEGDGGHGVNLTRFGEPNKKAAQRIRD